jgi:hypothetical protein
MHFGDNVKFATLTICLSTQFQCRYEGKFKWILKKCGKVYTGLNWLRILSSDGVNMVRNNKVLRNGKCIDQLNSCQLFKKLPASWC